MWSNVKRNLNWNLNSIKPMQINQPTTVKPHTYLVIWSYYMMSGSNTFDFDV